MLMHLTQLHPSAVGVNVTLCLIVCKCEESVQKH
jgi:hypothetical protein